MKSQLLWKAGKVDDRDNNEEEIVYEKNSLLDWLFKNLPTS